MVTDIPLHNLAILVGLIALLSYLTIRLSKSEKPIRQHPPYFIMDGVENHTEEEYAEQDAECKKQYYKEWSIYFVTYFVPVILALNSFVAIFDLNIGIIFLILTVISWVISEFAIKIWDIGKKEFIGQV